MDPTSATAVIQAPVLESIHTKCGELFISNKGEFLFYCSFWFCNEQFKTFHHFATHLFEHHYSRLNIIELPQQQKNVLLPSNSQQLPPQFDESVICLSDSSTDDEEEEITKPINLQTPLINTAEMAGKEHDTIKIEPTLNEGLVDENIKVNSIVIAQEIIQPLQYIKESNKSIQILSNQQIEKPNKDFEITKNFNNITNKIVKNDINTNQKRKKYGKISNIEVMQHQKEKTKNELINYSEYSVDNNDDLECRICGKILLSESGLKSHMKRHINGSYKKKKKMKNHQYKIFNKPNNIIESITTNHNNDKIEYNEKQKNNDNNKIYKCRYCDDTFKSKPYFIKHENNHINDNKIYKCDLCERSYFSESTLKLHRLIHTNDRTEFQCNICNKKLLTERYLEIHKMKHIIKMEKLIECNYCHLKYSEKYLPIHELIHTDGLKFKCNTCDKKFLTKGHRDTHEKKHKGNKDFICDICQKTFYTKGNLQIHRKIHFKNKIIMQLDIN